MLFPVLVERFFLNKLPYLLIFLSPLIIIGHKLNFNIKVAWNNPKRILVLIIITIVILFIAVVANITTLYIAIERGDQAPRVWTLIVFMYVAAVASWFIIAGYVINKRYSAYLYIIAFLGIVFSSYLFLKTAIVQYPIVSNYAKAYDERVYHLTKTNNEKLVNEGDTLFLKPLPSSGLLLSAEITVNPDNYINKAIMKRYNLPFYVILNQEK
jgi:hypothetical protein